MRLLAILFIAFCGTAAAHTLFVKPGMFVAEPGTLLEIKLINGTFLASENRVTRAMARSVDIIGPGNNEHELASDDWVSIDNMSVLSAAFAEPGNYVVAVSTKPRKVTLDADTFNFYLRYEGLNDQRDEREALGEAATAAVEQYTKFAKAIVQIGEEQTANYAAELGHDVEIVPLTNPYELAVGDTFRARVKRDGMPAANMQVFATHEGYLPMDEEGIYDEAVKIRSDEDGLVEFAISDPGKWYVRFIDLRRESDAEYWYSGLLVSLGADEKKIVYESKWATLSFEIR